MRDDLLEFAAPTIADVVSGRKKSSAAKSMARQPVIKRLSSGSR